MRSKDLQRRAKVRYARVVRRRRDSRYRRVIGRFVAAGLLTTNDEVEPYRGPIAVSDALWAGELEPRIVELLPALLVKRPSFFVDVTDLPADVAAVVSALRHNETPPELRGIPGEAIARWLPAIGHRGKLPSQLMSFRMQPSDVDLLTRLARALNASRTSVIRRGLRALAAKLQPDRGPRP